MKTILTIEDMIESQINFIEKKVNEPRGKLCVTIDGKYCNIVKIEKDV